MVTIISPAYGTPEYIEEFLIAASRQQKVDEILVGIDGCCSTLRKVISIRYKFNNLRIFWMKENKGTYVTLNTLLGQVKSEYVQIAGSDDKMTDDCVGESLKAIIENDADVVRPLYYMLENGVVSSPVVRSKKNYAHGGVLIKMSVFDLVGGFQPYRTSADSDLIHRLEMAGCEIVLLDKRLIYYRRHSKSLTRSLDTKMGSLARQENKLEMAELRNKGIIKVEKVVNNFIEL